MRARICDIENLHSYLYFAVRNISKSYLRKYKNISFTSFDEVQLPYFKVDLTPEDIYHFTYELKGNDLRIGSK